MRGLFVLMLVCTASARAAADCDAKAKPVFTRDEAPIAAPTAAAPARTQTLVIRASGAWTRTTVRLVPGAPPRNDVEQGCMPAARTKLLDAALARAKFQLDPTGKRCKLAPYAHVVFAAPARKRSVAHDEPCGVRVDAATAVLIDCARMVIDPTASDDDLARACPAP